MRNLHRYYNYCESVCSFSGRFWVSSRLWVVDQHFEPAVTTLLSREWESPTSLLILKNSIHIHISIQRWSRGAVVGKSTLMAFSRSWLAIRRWCGVGAAPYMGCWVGIRTRSNILSSRTMLLPTPAGASLTHLRHWELGSSACWRHLAVADSSHTSS